MPLRLTACTLPLDQRESVGFINIASNSPITVDCLKPFATSQPTATNMRARWSVVKHLKDIYIEIPRVTKAVVSRRDFLRRNGCYAGFRLIVAHNKSVQIRPGTT